MLSDIKSAMISQLGAALTMAETAANNCPDDIWKTEIRGHPVWRVLYHALFYVDFYGNSLDPTMENPEEQFKLSPVFQDTDVISPHFEEATEAYVDQSTMMKYVEFLRGKTNNLITNCSESLFLEKARFSWHSINNLEMVIYFTRHVMQHVGHVSAYIREREDISVPWSGKWPKTS